MFQEENKMLTLNSMVDWLITRYYRMEEKIRETMFRHNLTDRVPPSDLDLTDLLDKADRQNTLRETLK